MWRAVWLGTIWWEFWWEMRPACSNISWKLHIDHFLPSCPWTERNVTLDNGTVLHPNLLSSHSQVWVPALSIWLPCALRFPWQQDSSNRSPSTSVQPASDSTRRQEDCPTHRSTSWWNMDLRYYCTRNTAQEYCRIMILYLKLLCSPKCYLFNSQSILRILLHVIVFVFTFGRTFSR